MAPVVRRRARQLICKPRSIEAERSKRLRGITQRRCANTRRRTRLLLVAVASMRERRSDGFRPEFHPRSFSFGLIPRIPGSHDTFVKGKSISFPNSIF